MGDEVMNYGNWNVGVTSEARETYVMMSNVRWLSEDGLNLGIDKLSIFPLVCEFKELLYLSC
jgi:hypothetical protein